jgi:hypothetical protein
LFLCTDIAGADYQPYDTAPYAAIPWGDSKDHATQISKLRELTDDELSAVGGGSTIWGGVGGAISLSWLGPVASFQAS